MSKIKEILREEFDYLFKFITDSDLSKSSSSMHPLLHAYDFDDEGRKKLKDEGKTEEEIKIEYQRRKDECKWEIQGIEDLDIMLGIEAFFQLTSESSGCIPKELVPQFAKFRKSIFDTYIEQLHRAPEEKGKLIDDNLLNELENIFKNETLLAQILKYFGIADEEKTYHIGELEIVFKDFAYRYKEVTKDFSCVAFLRPFRLLRTVRNIYAIHKDRSASQLNKDFVDFSKFYVANVIGALRFSIYFYITLCTLINRAWRKVKSVENNNLKHGKPTMNNPQVLRIPPKDREYPPFTLKKKLFEDSKVKVNFEFHPLPGHLVERISFKDNSIDFQSGSDGCIDLGNYTLGRTDYVEFRVKLSSMKDMQLYVEKLDTRKIWDGSTIVFRQDEAPVIINEEEKKIRGVNQMKPEPAAIQAEKPADKVKTLEPERIDDEIITSWSGYWQLKFRPGVATEESNEVFDCVLDEIEKIGYDNSRIVVPDEVWGQQRRYKVTSVSSLFWSKLKDINVVIIIPKDLHLTHPVPNNVEVFTKKNYSVDEEFCYKAKSGLTFKCKYIDSKGDDYGNCSIIGIDLENGEETSQTIVVPEYACGLRLTEINARAFEGNKADEILLPYSVRSIGDGAFAGSSIWRMRFPSGIQQINAHMFENCENLQTFKSDGTIKSIGEYAFAGCKGLELVRFGNHTGSIRPSLIISSPDGQIPEGAFMNCCQLESARIDVKRIKARAFEGCTNLRYVDSDLRKVSDYDFSIEEIGESAFAECPIEDLFGASKNDFIWNYESNPNRKKLVRIFDSYKEVSDSEKTPQKYPKSVRILIDMQNRHTSVFFIIYLLIDGILIYLFGKYVSWW